MPGLVLLLVFELLGFGLVRFLLPWVAFVFWEVKEEEELVLCVSSLVRHSDGIQEESWRRGEDSVMRAREESYRRA